MPISVDQELVVRQLTEKIDRTTSPRQRKMLGLVRDHAIAEAAASLEGLMNTLGAHPKYHFWELQGDAGPKGRDEIAAYYTDFIASKRHIFEYDCARIIVDDDYVVTEAVLRMLCPGVELAKGTLGGVEADASAHYLLEIRNLVIWPFDDDLKIIGEDSYSGGPVHIRKLSADELPVAYAALLEPTA